MIGHEDRPQKFQVGERVAIDGRSYLIAACSVKHIRFGESGNKVYTVREDVFQETYTLPEDWLEKLAEPKPMLKLPPIHDPNYKGPPL